MMNELQKRGAMYGAIYGFVVGMLSIYNRHLIWTTGIGHDLQKTLLVRLVTAPHFVLDALLICPLYIYPYTSFLSQGDIVLVIIATIIWALIIYIVYPPIVPYLRKLR